MGKAASGTVYARYGVTYRRVSDGAIRERTCALITDYTKFEDLRKMIAILEGGGIDNIHVISAQEVPA
jgi:hypothetical protein